MEGVSIMRKFGFLSALLAVCVFFTATAYADFSDMPHEGRAKTAILHAVSNGILSGYEDGTVRPDNYITRAEMASIITRALGAAQEGDISFFTDVSSDKWYYLPLSKAYAMGAFRGDGNYNMLPNNNITFQETFTVLSQVFDLLPPYTRTKEAPNPLPDDKVYTPANYRLYDVSALNERTDTAGVADWAKVFVAGLVASGSCNDITIAPSEYITRAEFAIVMDNIIQNYIDTPGTYETLPEGNTIIRANGVFLSDVTTDSDIFIADGVSQNGIMLNNVKANRLVVRGCATPTDELGKRTNDDFGITISGTFDAIRIIRPNIVADLMPANYDKLYTAEGTVPNLGRLIEN